MEWQEKLREAVGYNKEKRVSVIYQDKTSVFTHTGEAVEDAIKDTDAYNTLAAIVASPPFTSRGASNVMDTLREESLLNGYRRGSGGFYQHVVDAFSNDSTAYNNGWVEVDLDQMDHKRAMATVTCQFETTAATLLDNFVSGLYGWKLGVYTDLGYLEIEC